MTDERLDELERLAAAATPGPLTVGPIPADEEPDTWLIGARGLAFARVVGSPGRSAEADAVFYATARTAVPELVAELKRLRAELERIRRANEARSRVSGGTPLNFARRKEPPRA
jgi:hypothetical protein